MSHRFHTRQVVRWKDIDSWGVLNNAVYLTLLEQARYEYCRALGILVDGQIRFVLAEVRVRFAAPGRMGTTLDVAARTTSLRGSSFTMVYEVRDGARLLAEAESVLVWVDDDLRPAQIPDPVRAAIAAYEGIPARTEPRAGRAAPTSRGGRGPTSARPRRSRAGRSRTRRAAR